MSKRRFCDFNEWKKVQMYDACKHPILNTQLTLHIILSQWHWFVKICCGQKSQISSIMIPCLFLESSTLTCLVFCYAFIRSVLDGQYWSKYCVYVSRPVHSVGISSGRLTGWGGGVCSPFRGGGGGGLWLCRQCGSMERWWWRSQGGRGSRRYQQLRWDVVTGHFNMVTAI